MAKRELTPEERHAIGQRFIEGRRRAKAMRDAAAALEMPKAPEEPAKEVDYMELARRIAAEFREKEQLREAASIAPMKPLTWRDLPHDARKCARNPRISDDAAVYKARCNNCRLEMWTRSEIEDICEVCEFVLIDEKHRLRLGAERGRGGRMVNPLRESGGGGTFANPFSRGIKLL